MCKTTDNVNLVTTQKRGNTESNQYVINYAKIGDRLIELVMVVTTTIQFYESPIVTETTLSYTVKFSKPDNPNWIGTSYAHFDYSELHKAFAYYVESVNRIKPSLDIYALYTK